MSRIPLFGCDACGERFGHLNELFPIDIRYSTGGYEEAREEELHGCLNCIPPKVTSSLDSVDWIGFPDASGEEPAEVVMFEGATEPVRIPELDVRGIEGEPYRESEFMHALEWVKTYLVAQGVSHER